MSEKKRKRRSFWEQDSEKVVSWLDAQADLGTSLQLIIVDAIRKYGDGDVIKSHLNQRETHYDGTEPQALSTQPVRNGVLKEGAASDETGPEAPTMPSGSKLERESELESDVKTEAESTPDDESFDIANAMAGAADENKEEDDHDYDPISIMMRDSGSKLNK